MMSEHQFCLFLLLFASIMFFTAIQGLRNGEIRAGNMGFKPYRPSRALNPMAFWFFVALNFALGTFALGYSAAIFFGVVQPHGIHRHV